MISIIVARARNGTIGHRGDIPWRGQLPADMAHFRDLTMGHAVIMGRSTYLSIPGRFRPLEGRFNIVLSRNPRFAAPCRVVCSLGTALHLGQRLAPGEVFVIGGKAVYDEALALADRIYLTSVDADFEGDVSFPSPDDTVWRMLSDPEEHEAEGRNRYPYSFVTYERRQDVAP